MPHNYNVFDERMIIPELSHEPGLVTLAPRKIDFLPGLIKNSITDMQVLGSWTEHFKARDVPFAVLENGNKAVMWKIDEIEV